MNTLNFVAVGLAALALQGCLAKAAVSAVTLPVRVASKAVDVATTSQSEADQKRGRDIRQREERLGKLERAYGRQLARCQNGNEAACTEAQSIRSEMEVLLPGVPAMPDR